jgi:hypothetical protein
MKRQIAAVAATAVLTALTLTSAMPAAPAFAAQSEACLQNNHIWGWRVVNERLLILNDLNYRPFLVHLTGGCVGLTNAVWAIRIRTWTSLGCLGQGDRVSFRAPALGQMSCVVTSVEPYFGEARDRYTENLDRNYNRYDSR